MCDMHVFDFDAWNFTFRAHAADYRINTIRCAPQFINFPPHQWLENQGNLIHSGQNITPRTGSFLTCSTLNNNGDNLSADTFNFKLALFCKSNWLLTGKTKKNPS